MEICMDVFNYFAKPTDILNHDLFPDGYVTLSHLFITVAIKRLIFHDVLRYLSQWEIPQTLRATTAVLVENQLNKSRRDDVGEEHRETLAKYVIVGGMLIHVLYPRFCQLVLNTEDVLGFEGLGRRIEIAS